MDECKPLAHGQRAAAAGSTFTSAAASPLASPTFATPTPIAAAAIPAAAAAEFVRIQKTIRFRYGRWHFKPSVIE